MTAATSSRAGVADIASGADPSWLQAQVERARTITEAAVRRLGLSDDVAREVARGGGLMLDGLVGSVTVMPIGSGNPEDTAPLLITLDTGVPAASLPAEEVFATMALSSTLLAHRVSAGLSLHGTLCLYRVVHAADAPALEQGLHEAWHLARLMWHDASSSNPGAQ
jgi:hypothetical protein